MIRGAARLARSALCGGLWLSLAHAMPAQQRDWDFEVRLDGRPVGAHRFTLRTEGERRWLRSEADFTVRLAGIPLYRYRHRADEQWRGDCLRALQASTDDDGERTEVSVQPEAPDPATGPGGPAPPLRIAPGGAVVAGCVMSFAYWNPAILRQSRLLNAQTGRLEAVRIARVDAAQPGAPDGAARWRLDMPGRPIDILYAADGAWIGLDATVAGGRRLSYRLRPSPTAASPATTSLRESAP